MGGDQDLTSHSSLLIPHGAVSPHTYLLPGHQTGFCSSICGSGQGTTQGCPRSSLPQLYPKGSQGKDKERRAFCPKHEDGWQQGSTAATAFAAPLWPLFSLSQLPSALRSRALFAKSYKQETRKLNAALSYCFMQGGCELLSPTSQSALCS